MARSKQVQNAIESLKNSPEEWKLKGTMFNDQLVNNNTVIDTEYLRIYRNGATIYSGNSYLDNKRLKKSHKRIY